MKKPIIAVDVDDVLAISVQGFVDFSNERWGTRLGVDDYTEHWAEMWSVDQDEHDKRAQAIYDSHMMADFKRFEDAEEILRKLAKNYKLVITTSRVRHVQQDTLDWLDQHFKGLFDEIYLAGIYDSHQPEAYKQTKIDLCQSIGAHYLIDDHPKHCFAVAEVGIKALLFGDYVWNRNLKIPDGVTRVKDWQAILEYFDGRG